MFGLSNTIRMWLLAPVIQILERMEDKMADVSQVLNTVAEGLRGPLTTSIRALIASEAAARSELATLQGEDVSESTAAADVVAAFNEVSEAFAPADLPDVEPLPEPAPVDEDV